MKRIYLDSNVIISLVCEEVGAGLKGLFVEARDFLEIVAKNNHLLVLSDLFFYEVKRRTLFERNEVLKYLQELSVNVEIFKAKKKPFLKNIEEKGVHYPDSLHVGLALQANCDCIVTFNTKDFEVVSNMIKIKDPADFT